MKKKIILIVLTVLVAGLAYMYMTRDKEFFYNGTVEAVEVSLSSRITGEIIKYHAEEGSEVKAGDLLVEIDSKDLELAYDLARRDFDRAKELVRTNTITQERYDALKYKYDDAKTKLSWAKITAPISGTVIHKFHENGELASPGTRLLTVTDMKEVDVNIYIPHDSIAKIAPGDEVKGFLPEMSGREFTGKISFINDKSEFTPRNVLTKSERSRLVYRVKIKFPNTENILKTGMTLEVKIPD